MKRAEWKNLKAKRRGLRTLAFMILFLAIAGGVVAFVFSFSKMREGGLSLQHSATERAEAAPANH